MDELAAWLWSDTCALDGCENLLLGYPWNALYCCRAHRDKVRAQTPERKASEKARRQTPQYKATRKAHYQTPEYKAANKARKQTPEYKAAIKARRDSEKAKYQAMEEELIELRAKLEALSL